MTPIRRLAAVLALSAPLAAGALEPRYDHRDQHGPLAAVELWRDSVAISGRPTMAEVRPRLRLGWGFDVSGEGDELILGGGLRLASWDDPAEERYRFGLDARYRGYFGTEELKTFFELGLWAELQQRVAVGPQVGLGLAYDPSRAWGAFLSLHFGTAIGDARIASIGASAGVQLRFE